MGIHNAFEAKLRVKVQYDSRRGITGVWEMLSLIWATDTVCNTKKLFFSRWNPATNKGSCLLYLWIRFKRRTKQTCLCFQVFPRRLCDLRATSNVFTVPPRVSVDVFVWDALCDSWLLWMNVQRSHDCRDTGITLKLLGGSFILITSRDKCVLEIRFEFLVIIKSCGFAFILFG